MVQENRAAGTPPQNRLEAERKSLAGTASEAANTAKKEAKAFGAEATHAGKEQAEKIKEAAASHLDSFADALRAAGDELEKNQTGPAAELISHAVSGLENLSRSVHGQSTGQMVDAVRRFGRENPLGFIAGSVLAGFALGRFASAVTPDRGSGGSDSRMTGSTPARGGNS